MTAWQLPVGRVPLEHEEQQDLIRWFRRTFPDVRIFAIPNGGNRSKSEAGRLKAEGVSPGVPDLFAPALLLWIELKRQKGGKLDAEQKDWHEYLAGIGQKVIVPRGSAEAQKMILEFIAERLGGSSRR